MRTALSPSSLSRRGLLRTGGFSLLSFLGGTAAVHAASGSSPKKNPVLSAVEAGQDRDRHMTIEVMVNGHGPYNFVVDTGAVRSVLSESVVKDAGVQCVEQVSVTGVSGVFMTRLVRVQEMSFGAVRQTNIEVPVLPDDQLDADGYIGLDMIDRFHVTFDFKKSELRVAEPRLFRDASSAENISAVPTGQLYGGLRVSRCQVDGVDTTLFIDTGASVTVGNPALMKALLQNNAQVRINPIRSYISDVAGGSQAGHRVDFGALQVGGVKFSRGTLLITDLNAFKRWGLHKEPALLLGMNFLRQFETVSIDYIGQEFQFEVGKARWG